MVQLGVIDYIPKQYILNRWRVLEEMIVVDKMELPQVPTDRKINNKERQFLHYGTLCNDFTNGAKIGCTSDKGKALADKNMDDWEKELKSTKASDSAKWKKRTDDTTQGDSPCVENTGDAGQGSSSKYDHVEDPLYTNTKWHPREKRKQFGLHFKSSKVVKCIVCGSIQHTETICPSKLTPRPEPKEIDFFRDMV
jgi:hypothetical protein